MENRVIGRADVVVALEDALARKATSTIAKRLGALSRFASWCASEDFAPFPLLEKIAYCYIKHLQTSGCAPTAGKSFVEAVHFSVGMLGLQVDEVFTGSQRIRGVADSMAASAPVVVQAQALTVAQVMRMEQFCCGDACLQDVCTVGGMLVLLYGCAGVSDGQRATAGILDLPDQNAVSGAIGFFELEVIGSKTAYTLDKKRRVLPVVAPLFSLSDSNWVEAWLSARDRLGLQTHGRLDRPLICKFTSSGEPSTVQASSSDSDIGRMLRHVISATEEKPNQVRSHSLKVTPLSWVGKFGILLAERRALGHHLDPNAVSAETYTRDSMAAPVRSLISVLQAITSPSASCLIRHALDSSWERVVERVSPAVLTLNLPCGQRLEMLRQARRARSAALKQKLQAVKSHHLQTAQSQTHPLEVSSLKICLTSRFCWSGLIRFCVHLLPQYLKIAWYSGTNYLGSSTCASFEVTSCCVGGLSRSVTSRCRRRLRRFFSA